MEQIMSSRSNRYKRKNTRRSSYSRQKKIKTARDVRQRGGTRVKQNKKLPIPLRVLLIMIIPMIIVHLINALLLGGFYSLASIAFIIIYFVAGFIGGNFVHFMLKKYNDYKIICLDALTYAGNMETLAPALNNPNFRFVKGDISDREIVFNLFEEEDFVVDIKEYWHFDYGNASWALEKGENHAFYGAIEAKSA